MSSRERVHVSFALVSLNASGPLRLRTLFFDNTSRYGADGKILEGGSNYARAHGKGEPKVSRFPFGCEVIFVLQDTKKLGHGKWEGSGEVGVIAGYGLNAGYHWNGEYLCWSLKELARVDMHEHASKYPFSLS